MNFETLYKSIITESEEIAVGSKVKFQLPGKFWMKRGDTPHERKYRVGVVVDIEDNGDLVVSTDRSTHSLSRDRIIGIIN
jgi:hypothetical protein